MGAVDGFCRGVLGGGFEQLGGDLVGGAFCAGAEAGVAGEGVAADGVAEFAGEGAAVADMPEIVADVDGAGVMLVEAFWLAGVLGDGYVGSAARVVSWWSRVVLTVLLGVVWAAIGDHRQRPDITRAAIEHRGEWAPAGARARRWGCRSRGGGA